MIPTVPRVLAALKAPTRSKTSPARTGWMARRTARRRRSWPPRWRRKPSSARGRGPARTSRRPGAGRAGAPGRWPSGAAGAPASSATMLPPAISRRRASASSVDGRAAAARPPPSVTTSSSSTATVASVTACGTPKRATSTAREAKATSPVGQDRAVCPRYQVRSATGTGSEWPVARTIWRHASGRSGPARSAAGRRQQQPRRAQAEVDVAQLGGVVGGHLHEGGRHHHDEGDLGRPDPPGGGQGQSSTTLERYDSRAAAQRGRSTVPSSPDRLGGVPAHAAARGGCCPGRTGPGARR